MEKFNELREIPVDEEMKFEGKLIDVTHMRVKLPNGRVAYREIVKHNGAAAVVPIDAEGNVYLVIQHRIAVDQMMLEIPAGKLDSPGEDPYDCAVRELSEETGLVAKNVRLLNHVVTTPGFCTEKIGLYLATGLTQADVHLDQDEFLNVIKIPLTQAIDMVMSGEINDAKTVAGLLLAKEKLARES